MAEKFYPVALSLRGRRCVVVGGGAVGARKAIALAECGANVVVVAPTVAPELAEEITSGQIQHLALPFQSEHLRGAFLCIAATDRPEVNAAVAEAARLRGILLNLAAPAGANPINSTEISESGDFVTMAAVRRGELLLALTTGGAGPAVAARLRKQWENDFGPEWSLYMELLREMRTQADTLMEPDRTIALRRLAANPDVLKLLQNGEIAAARQEATRCLEPLIMQPAQEGAKCP